MKTKIKQSILSRLKLFAKKKEWIATGILEQKGLWQKATAHASIVFLAAFTIAFLAASLIVPNKPAEKADAATDTLTAGDYYVTINSTDVSMNLLTVPTGATMTVVKNQVTASTNSPNGYKLYLGMSAFTASGSKKSAADQQKNGLYLDGNLSRTDGELIAAAPGSVSSGLAELADNTWGYAVGKNTTGAPSVWSTEDHTEVSSSLPTSDKFAGVPAVGNEDLIQQIDDLGGQTEVSYTNDIYYGIRATTAKNSGAYSNTIAYTAVAEIPTEQGKELSFSPARYDFSKKYESMTWTDYVTITTPIYTNMEDLGTATVTLSGGPDNVSNLSCGNATLSTVNNRLTVSCNLPQAKPGEYNITVTTTKFSQTFTGKYTYHQPLNTLSNMQEMTPALCANADEGESATLTDSRDSNTYTIKKLKDGNCWMTQNLHLNGPRTLTSADSDVTTNFSLPASNSGAWCIENSAACNNQSMILDSNDASYGTYYNWYAATASTGTYELSSNEATSSVCPRGWRLPTGYPYGELQTLFNNYDSYDAMVSSDGPAFVQAGEIYTTIYMKGERGYYWSSTAANNNLARNFFIGLYQDEPHAYNYASMNEKFGGRSVRCIAPGGFTLNISNNNTTSSQSSIDIPKGKTRTITVTPNSGYYLSNVTCPTGYTCSGYNTGPSNTGTQTVTLTNDSATTTQTLAFTGTALTLSQMCGNTAIHGTFTYAGVEYIKLKTSPDNSTAACYTHQAVGITNFTNAPTLCPTGTGVPTVYEYQALLDSYGRDGTLNSVTGWSAAWSATATSETGYLAYVLSANSSSATTSINHKSQSYPVLCIVQ